MAKNYYYPKTLEMINNAVISMFTDMTVYRFDTSGTIINTIPVPVTFGPVEKTFQFKKEQESGKQYYLTLPRIAVTFNGHAQATGRSKASNTERFIVEGEESSQFNYAPFIDYEPVPYDYLYTVAIRTEFVSDYAQIMENILPYFSPDATSIRVREFSFLNVERDLSVKMTSVQSEMEFSFDDQSMREINGNFNLNVEGYAYRPLSATGKIKEVDVKYFIGDAATWFEETKVTGYATSAEMPPTSAYYTSGVNNNGIYYTESNTSTL